MNTEIHVPKHYLFCSRGYAISMDTGIGRENRIMLMMTRFPLVTISIATKLGIISLDCERMQSVEPILREYLGSVSYLSLEGKKISFWKAHQLFSYVRAQLSSLATLTYFAISRLSKYSFVH